MGSTHVGACAVCLAPGVVGVVEGGTCAATCAIALIGPVPLVGRPMVRVIGVIVLRPPSPRSTSDGEVFARKNYLKNANSTVTSRNLERNSRALLPDEQVFGLFLTLVIKS